MLKYMLDTHHNIKKFKIEVNQKMKHLNFLNLSKTNRKSWCFFLLALKSLSPYAAKKITNEINIPTIGIGSSLHCDGQILVTDDMLGISGLFTQNLLKNMLI